MAQKKTVSKKISTSKKIIYNFIIVVLVLLVLGIVELSLRAFNYGTNLPLFVESDKYPGYYEINNDINLRYFSKTINTKPGNDIFLKEKTNNTYRIFVFGGSTAKGYPYQISNSFSRILHFRLIDAFPNKNIEVINLSAAAINSFTYIDLIDEVLEQKPDLILLYGGHNEYYGAMGAASTESFGNSIHLRRLRIKASRLKLVQLIQNTARNIQYALNNSAVTETQTLMQRIVKDSDITLNSKKYVQGIKQFESNLDLFVKKATKNNVPVVLSELVSNLRHQEPFKSIETDNNPAADKIYNEAKLLDNEGKYAEALQKYTYAKDLDAIRFRAPEEFNNILHGFAQKYGIPIVPMIDFFENHSENRMIGNSLMVDHLHPNIDGYFVMADAFFNTLKINGLISPQWDENRTKPSAYFREIWGVSLLDSMVAELNVQSLKAGWPFQPESTINLFIENYQPEGYLDSVAHTYVNKGGIYIEDEHIKLAKMFAGTKNYPKAFNEYASIVRLHPYLPHLYLDAANYLILQKKYEQAYTFLSSTPKFEKGPKFYYLSGVLNLDLDNDPQAIADLEHALEIGDSTFNKMLALRPLLFAYQRNAYTDKIEHLLEQYPQLAVQTQPESGKTKRIEKKVSFEQAMQIVGELIKNGEYKQAEELLLVLNQKEQSYEVLKLLSKLYYFEKDYKKAYNTLGKAYAMNDSDTEVLAQYYIMCVEFGNIVEANQIIEKLRKLNFGEAKIEQLKQVKLQ